MRLLLVEDKDSFRRLLLKALASTSWEVLEADDPAKALKILETGAVNIMATDLRLPGFSGLELIKRARRFNPSMRIIMMSAFGEPGDIVEAMRLGADDFLPKPFDLDVFLSTLEKMRVLLSSPPPDQREPWVAASKEMRSLENNLRAVANTTAPVIFVGQPGTGRSRTARRLHVLRHPQAPFHARFARDLHPESLSESFLKDHGGGSLFFKDLEHLPAATLPALLSAMERHPALCWMGACQDPLSLPESLRCALGVIPINLAPLAERVDDVLPLFYSRMAEICAGEGRITPLVDRSVEKELMSRDWPGNAAELTWIVSQSLRACPGGLLKELPTALEAQSQSILLPKPPGGSLDKMLRGVAVSAERYFLEEALKKTNGDTARAAKDLGLTQKSYIQKLKECGIAIEYKDA
ncbi:MAG: response regulator [Holophagales bacterium]|nr:response regulator [Holophagales bacterium]